MRGQCSGRLQTGRLKGKLLSLRVVWLLALICWSLDISYRHHNNEPITGIIYLRSIQEPRVLRAETTLMKMFKELCGADCLDHILVVTNRWQPPPEKEEEDREQQMVTDIRRFGSTGSKRVLVQRLSGKYTQEDAHRVLELFRYIPPVTFRIQQEMVDQGLRYDQTTAGKVIEDALTAKVEELRAELASQKNVSTVIHTM